MTPIFCLVLTIFCEHDLILTMLINSCCVNNDHGLNSFKNWGKEIGKWKGHGSIY